VTEESGDRDDIREGKEEDRKKGRTQRSGVISNGREGG
jgi:hypothetical protein